MITQNSDPITDHISISKQAKKQWEKPELLVMPKGEVSAKHTYPQHEHSPGVGSHHGGFFRTNAYLS